MQFRKHLNFSRDFRKLFASFQSSANVLDPNANKQLFNSQLVVIIKDVLEADREGALRE
jgi:hypothetical protein